MNGRIDMVCILVFIRPGKPVENAYVESFNGKECLNEHWFVSMRDARQRIEAWRCEYNEERPHSSLGWLTPQQFADAHCSCVDVVGQQEQATSF